MIHSEKAYGKINLAMNILGRRPDGYHEVDTVYQSVSLHDDILFEASQTFRLTCSRNDLVCDETNLAYKAYTALLPFCDGRGRYTFILTNIFPWRQVLPEAVRTVPPSCAV